MSTPKPSGRVEKNANGIDLVLTRILPLELQEAWAAITESEKTSRWIGRWEGTGAQGQTIRLQMGFEEGSSWSDVVIAECRAPNYLRVQTVDDSGSWDLSIDLASADEATELRFVHRGLVPGAVGDIGPGWEYYFDQLLASITGGPLPVWDDYYPAQRGYFQGQEG
ncbi:SRPBCC domain-containing protein [Glutamicibacter protophormiae]|uniref:SRPBCC domain-containing protein n=1 Tax=Glutamicibacter protophormiae TaxID=37930 RepID=UPI00332B4E11